MQEKNICSQTSTKTTAVEENQENDYYRLLNDFEQTNYLQNGQQIQRQEYTQTE